MVPTDRILVSESGIATHDDIVRLIDAQVNAVLVGETLMRAENITQAIHNLLHGSATQQETSV